MANLILTTIAKQFLPMAKNKAREVNAEICVIQKDTDTAQIQLHMHGKIETAINVPYGKNFEAEKLIEAIMNLMIKEK